jgi:hypothetical protein
LAALTGTILLAALLLLTRARLTTLLLPGLVALLLLVLVWVLALIGVLVLAHECIISIVRSKTSSR